MSRKRKADVDPDYDPEAANHHGEMMKGDIAQLTESKSKKKIRNYDGSGKVGFLKAKK